MVLTNCQQCKYLDRNPHHSGDINCGISPAYASAWKRLNSLDEYTRNCVPIDNCREFELDSEYEEKEITLSLTYEQWQTESVRRSLPQQFQSQLWLQTIDITIALTFQQWRNLAASSINDSLIEQLSQQGIETETDDSGDWVELDSSCIEAVAFDESSSVLKIRFNSGSVYEYYDFDRLKFSDFRNASSHGSFFNREIKNIYHYSLSE